MKRKNGIKDDMRRKETKKVRTWKKKKHRKEGGKIENKKKM